MFRKFKITKNATVIDKYLKSMFNRITERNIRITEQNDKPTAITLKPPRNKSKVLNTIMCDIINELNIYIYSAKIILLACLLNTLYTQNTVK